MIFMENKNTYCVYIHTNKINGKKYVGQTVYGDNPNRRWMNGYGYQEGTYFRYAINKYGWDNFQHDIIMSNLTKEEANNFEKMFISLLHTNNCKFGYNLTDGGEGLCGYVMLEEFKKKISNSHKDKPLSDAHKVAISKSHIGKQHTEDHSEKISIGHMNTHCMYYESIYKVVQYDRDGIFANTYDTIEEASKDTDISIDDIKRCLMGRTNVAGDFIWMFVDKSHIPHIMDIVDSKQTHKNGKSVCQYDKNGVLIKKWNSITEAANALRMNKNNIWKCCNHLEGRKTAGGFIWKYSDELLTTQND